MNDALGNLSSGNLTTLRRLAEQATPGPWRTYYGGEPCEIGAEKSTHVCTVKQPPVDGRSPANARFIAATSPTIVLALLDEIERLRSRIAFCSGSCHE